MAKNYRAVCPVLNMILLYLSKKLNMIFRIINHIPIFIRILPTVDWAKKIVITTRFSRETSTGLESGRITRKARDEIINSLSTLILVYTIHPMPDDYNIVCRNLVKKHPILKDHIGSGYVSLLIFMMINIIFFAFVGFLEEKASNEIQKSEVTCSC